MANNQSLSKAFTELATPTFDAAVVRRALFEHIAQLYGGVGNGWAAPTGISIKTTFNADASTVVSNPPTQAEVQAINDRLKETRQLLKAVIESLLL